MIKSKRMWKVLVLRQSSSRNSCSSLNHEVSFHKVPWKTSLVESVQPATLLVKKSDTYTPCSSEIVEYYGLNVSNLKGAMNRCYVSGCLVLPHV